MKCDSRGNVERHKAILVTNPFMDLSQPRDADI